MALLSQNTFGQRICSRRNALAVLASGAVGSTLTLFGCKTAAPKPPRRVWRTDEAGVVIEAPTSLRAERIAWVHRYLPDARSQCAVYGVAFPRSVLIGLHTDVRTFIAATGQNAHWLRAYAQFRRADFLTPDMWRDASDRTKRAKLIHELWHVASFQIFVDEKRAKKARVPLWFREGSASVIADQGFARMPRAQMQNALDAAGDDDPLTSPPTTQKVAYAAAHYAARALVQHVGRDVFADLLTLTKAYLDRDHPFRDAFVEVVGVSEGVFWQRQVAHTDQ